MTDCPNGDIRDLLPDLLHGRLDSTARARVEHHVASCDECRAELALLGDLRSTFHRAPVLDAAAIAGMIPPYRAPVRQRSWGGLRVAAAIAAIAVGGTSVAIVRRGSEPVTSPPHQNVATLPGGATSAPVAPTVREAALPTGSRTPSRASSTPPVTPAPSASEPVSLAMTGGAIGDLSDRELSTLVDEIETLDALPSEDVETAGAVTGSLSLEQSR